MSYSQKSRLHIHIRKHLGIKPFHCEFCGNKFTEKGNLTVHLKSHPHINIKNEKKSGHLMTNNSETRIEEI